MRAKKSPLELVAASLRFTPDACDSIAEFTQFTGSTWERTLQWLDDSGLAFYFLKRIQNSHSADAVPSWVIAHLERNYASNQLRVREMSRRFNSLNQQFHHAGVHYAAVKGFSLVPDFCPDASLRYQGDFDYLVDEASLSTAAQALRDAGYLPKPSPSREEFIFMLPGSASVRSSAQYSPEASYAVELHLDLWDGHYHGVDLPRGLLSTDGACTRNWNGCNFYGLSDDEAFLGQVLHACHHMFTEWIRMSCFLEIAFFLNRRAQDEALWNRVSRRVGDNLRLREFVVIVSEISARLFAAPLPSLVKEWRSHVRTGPGIWITNYSTEWAFCEFPPYHFRALPAAKLVRFLHREFKAPEVSQQKASSIPTETSEPRSRLSRIARTLINNPSRALDRAWWKRQMLFRRTLFHSLAWLRYLGEIPRWLWMNYSKRKSASPSGVMRPAVD